MDPRATQRRTGRQAPAPARATSPSRSGRAAVAADHRVRYFRADSLIEALYSGIADNTVGALIEKILRADLVVIDELGFAPLDRVGANHLFRLVAAAYEARSLLVTASD